MFLKYAADSFVDMMYLGDLSFPAASLCPSPMMGEDTHKMYAVGESCFTLPRGTRL